MSDKTCSQCAWRARYERDPKSILGRIWRWHAGWCPGWRRYMQALSDQERSALARKYNLAKFR